jgi:IS30 family transposase
MAETLKRSPSTISRELRRNSQDGHYGSGVAHRRCQARRRQARPLGKLHPSTVTFDVVRHFLGWRSRVRQFAPKIGPFLTSTAFNFNRLGS